jgi:DNA-binding response OmpR family regulator
MLEQPSQVDSEQRSGAVAKPRLLVIDDDTLHRMIVCRVAAKAGYAPAGAATCEEATKILQQGAFDCITLDLSLGGNAGVEMLRQLCLMGCTTPIVIISGTDAATRNETVAVAISLNLTVSGSMPKPVDLTVLRYWFERLQSGRGPAASAAA